MIDVLLTDSEAAEILNFAVGTLRLWRIQGRGPRFLRLGRSIRYRRSALEAWLAGRDCTSTAEYGLGSHGVRRPNDEAPQAL